jgi:succinate dehydrogenase/fumarate reductase flavoprotein subunit
MFPGMVDRCKDVGRDLSQEPVQVSPTGHFHMGGVKIDKDCYSGIPGLFVAGEDAGGVHGANRLGGNGVADSTVFGARAGEAAADYATREKQYKPSEIQIIELIADALKPFDNKSGENPFHLRKEIKKLMWEKVGLVRNATDLEAGMEKLKEIAERVDQCVVPEGKQYNLAWHEVLNIKNTVQIAQMIALSAYKRSESRGSHYRSDYPVTDNGSWYKNIVMENNGIEPTHYIQDVQFKYLDPEEIFGETARVKVETT